MFVLPYTRLHLTFFVSGLVTTHPPSFPLLLQRTEKLKEFDLFVLKIQKLEKLCRALQDERKILYEKIKEVRCVKANILSKATVNPLSQDETHDVAQNSPLLTDVELQELQEEDPGLTEDMARLREEQAKLQEFAASLLATSMVNDDDDKGDLDLEEDLMASAFAHFNTQTKAEEKPEQMEENPAVSVQAESPKPVPEPVKEEEDHKAAVVTPAALEEPTPEEKIQPPCEITQADPKAEVIEDKILAKEDEAQETKPLPKQNEEIQKQPESELVSTPEPEKIKTGQPTEVQPEGAEGKAMLEVDEVKPVVPVEAEKAQQQQQIPETQQTPEEAQTESESDPSSENNNSSSPKAEGASNGDTSKKQAPKKKKKKRGGKNAS